VFHDNFMKKSRSAHRYPFGEKRSNEEISSSIPGPRERRWSGADLRLVKTPAGESAPAAPLANRLVDLCSTNHEGQPRSSWIPRVEALAHGVLDYRDNISGACFEVESLTHALLGCGAHAPAQLRLGRQ